MTQLQTMTSPLMAAVACAARRQHDEPLQLGGLWRGGGEGPHSVLAALRRPEGGASRQSAPLRGHRLGAQEPLRPVSGAVWQRAAAMSPAVSVRKSVCVCVFSPSLPDM